VLGKIIAGDAPSVTAERRSAPSNVDAAIRRALEKVPADRFAAAPEFARALTDPSFGHTEDAGGRQVPGSAFWRAVALSAIVVAAVLGATTIRLALRPASQAPVVRLEFTTPDSILRSGGIALSNDGTKIVYRGISADGTSRLYLRQLDVAAPTPIAGTEGGGSAVHFSPDGTSIVFAAGNDVKTVSLDGGVVTIVQDSLSTNRATVRWGRDGMVYYTHRGGGIWRVRAAGGEHEAVTQPQPGEGDHVYVDLLPDATGIIFSIFGSGTEIAAASTSDGTVHRLLRDDASFTARYAASGHLVTLRNDGTFWAAPFDADRLEITGPSRPILEGAWVTAGLGSEFELSESGTLLYREAQAGIADGQVVWVSRDGSVEALSDEVRGSIEAVAVSPDGRRVAFDRGPIGQRDIWVYGFADSTLSRLTVDSDDDSRPTWSPDGREVGFASRKDGVQAFYAEPWDGSGPARLIRAPGEASIVFEADWTPDARSIVYRELPGVGGTRISQAPPQPDATPRIVLQDGFANQALSLSPDGEWLAYHSNQSGRREVWARPLAGPGGARLVSNGGGYSPVWSKDGRQIFYVSADGFFMTATVTTQPEFRVEGRERFASADGYATSTLIQRFDVSPDGQRILAIRSTTDAGSRDMIVFNFFEELKRIAPGN
jgi:serine/threonine-protein kinase